MTGVTRIHFENVTILQAPHWDAPEVNGYLLRNEVSLDGHGDPHLAASVFLAFGEAAQDVRKGQTAEIDFGNLTDGARRLTPPLCDTLLSMRLNDDPEKLNHRIGRGALRCYLRLTGEWRPWHVKAISKRCDDDVLRKLGRQIDEAVNPQAQTQTEIANSQAIIELAQTAIETARPDLSLYYAIQRSNRDYERQLRSQLMKGLNI